MTSVTLTADVQSYLVSTLDSKIRLMDWEDGKVLQKFTGHKNVTYRIKSCFGYGEATVMTGDEDGKIFIWSLDEVSLFQGGQDEAEDWSNKFIQGRLLLDKPVATSKTPILWTAHHPSQDCGLVTATSDGNVYVWNHT